MLEDLPSELDRGPLDPVRIFEALERHGVEYLTIGGVAVNAHGHLRNTRDVDVLIEWTTENMRRLAAALGELDAKLFGVDADLLEVDPLDPEDLFNGGNFTLRTAAGGLDLFDPAEIPGGRPYNEMRPRAVEATVAGVRIRAVGLDDLIRLKRESGRDRDLEDVATLLAATRSAAGEDELEP
jgi:predicted nucleotidyltransferase